MEVSMFPIAADRPLGDVIGGVSLHRWCTGAAAGAELATALATSAAPGPAPFFTAPGFGAWRTAFLADHPAASEAAEGLDALASGRAVAVVTGQQPGFLGGPLYTLYKIATAVALARRLAAAGRPAVPVFWSGDDDDDLVEALAAVAWSAGAGLVRSEARAAARQGSRPRRRVGALGAGDGQQRAARWLGDQPAAAPLARLWREALDEGWSWARLQRRALLWAFAGTGLVIVSGDDPALHQAAGPLYGVLRSRLEELADAARRAGHELNAAGEPVPVGERSLARPLYRADGAGRRALEPGEDAPAAEIRPGVMLRSAVQDWLLAPAAVIAGPGEEAYLRQLAGIHAALGIPRSPLVPRLFASLLPLDAALPAAPRDASAVTDRLDDWCRDTAASLADLLAGQGIEAGRAEVLAAGRLRRWRRGVAAVLRHDAARRRDEAWSRLPAWVRPDGLRQERSLAWAAAVGLWGDALVPTVLAAADRHLDHGLRHDWREFRLTVPHPREPEQ
jgi:hypothetical protein